MKLTLVFIALFLFSVASAQVPSYVPTTGLVGWWPFTGNANDESGDGNNGVPMNGISLTTNRHGQADQAYSFDGVDDYISIADSPMLRLMNTDFTFNAWVLPNSSSAYGHIWYKGRSAGNDSVKYMFARQTNQFAFHINGPGLANGAWALSSAAPIPAWQMCTIVRAGDTIRFFSDQNLLGNVLMTTPVNDTPGLDARIGGAEPDGQGGLIGVGWWQGKIDDIGLWNRALTLDEIAALYYGLQTSIAEGPDRTWLSLAPNPAHDHVTIAAAASIKGPFSISVQDGYGRELIRVMRSLGSGTWECPISEFAPGAYVVRLSYENGNALGRFIKY